MVDWYLRWVDDLIVRSRWVIVGEECEVYCEDV